MTTPQTPLLLVDNVFETVWLYPGATVSASSAADGHDAFRVADARRERSWWQPTSDGGGADTWLKVDLGATATRGVDYLWLDRGHNLWGRTVVVEGSTDGAVWNVSQVFTLPAQGTLGGAPAWPGVAVTEEGACYALAGAALAARRFWRFRIAYAAGFVPVVTGLAIGLKAQLLGYSSVFDEDRGERTEVTETSRAGYRAVDRTYSWRTCELGLAYIGSPEYDATIRTLRHQLFDLNAPWMLAMDYATYPERAWLFQYDGTSWGMAKTRAFRSGTLRGREVGASIA